MGQYDFSISEGNSIIKNFNFNRKQYASLGLDLPQVSILTSKTPHSQAEYTSPSNIATILNKSGMA